jgi:hypothetical protein
MEETIFGPRVIDKNSQRISSVPLLEMEAHPLKNVENAVIRL